MNTASNSTDDWEPCPAGTLEKMAKRLNAAERRRHTLRTLGAGVVGAALVAGVVLTIGLASTALDQGPIYGGITCRQCQGFFADYHAAQTEGIVWNKRLAESVKIHLASCPICRAAYNAAYSDEANQLSATASQPIFRIPQFAALSAWRPL